MCRRRLAAVLRPLTFAGAVATGAACSAGYILDGGAGGPESAGGPRPPGSRVGGSTSAPDVRVSPPAPTAGPSSTSGDGTLAPPTTSCLPLAAYFSQALWGPILQGTCRPCHTAAAVPGFPLDGDEAAAYRAATGLAAAAAGGGPAPLVAKPTGRVTHGGGALLAADSKPAAALQAFADAVGSGRDCAPPPAS